MNRQLIPTIARHDLSVLVVDDSEIVRSRMIEMIQKVEGVNLLAQAVDAESAMERFEEIHPNVVVLDIKLPGMNGMEALKQIKKIAPDTMVIMLTHYPYPQYRIACAEYGADHFFLKTTEFNQVPVVLNDLIRRRRNERQTTC